MNQDLKTEQDSALNPYAILIAAITGTLPDQWSNPQHFGQDATSFDFVPGDPYTWGNDIFAISALTHLDGRVGRVHYSTDDQVYVDCVDVTWSGPLEDPVHAYATWSLDFTAARLAYAIEVAQAKMRDAEIAAQAAKAMTHEAETAMTVAKSAMQRVNELRAEAGLAAATSILAA